MHRRTHKQRIRRQRRATEGVRQITNDGRRPISKSNAKAMRDSSSASHPVSTFKARTCHTRCPSCPSTLEIRARAQDVPRKAVSDLATATTGSLPVCIDNAACENTSMGVSSERIRVERGQAATVMPALDSAQATSRVPADTGNPTVASALSSGFGLGHSLDNVYEFGSTW